MSIMESSNYYLPEGKLYVFKQPEYAGYLELDPGFRVAFRKKPNWFNRQMIKLVFGWIWIDGKL